MFVLSFKGEAQTFSRSTKHSALGTGKGAKSIVLSKDTGFHFDPIVVCELFSSYLSSAFLNDMKSANPHPVLHSQTAFAMTDNTLAPFSIDHFVGEKCTLDV